MYSESKINSQRTCKALEIAEFLWSKIKENSPPFTLDRKEKLEHGSNTNPLCSVKTAKRDMWVWTNNAIDSSDSRFLVRDTEKLHA